MRDAKEAKVACTVNALFRDGEEVRKGPVHDAIAHVVEDQYAADFLCWYGSLDVACTFEEAIANYMTGSEIVVRLPDGRIGAAHVMSGCFSDHVQEVEGPEITVYFVGVTSLADPDKAEERRKAEWEELERKAQERLERMAQEELNRVSETEEGELTSNDG